jgi:DNA-binding transcriptional MerR regulator
MRIDELAAAAGVTTRSVRAFQTQGLLAHPFLRGRTGVYGIGHLERLQAIVHLQAAGFSLQSLAVLFAALEQGQSLASVLAAPSPDSATGAGTHPEPDSAELYGFADLQPARPRPGRPLLAVVPTTVWDQERTAAS